MDSVVTFGDMLAVFLACVVAPAVIPIAAGLIFLSIGKAILDGEEAH